VATPIRCKASIVVTCQNETKTISNVTYVLGVRKNLLPIGALTNMGCIVTFGNNKCWNTFAQFPHKVLVSSFKDFVDGLYKL
jgi:hypothetical protein